MEECIEREKCKLTEILDYTRVYNDGTQEDIQKQIVKLNDALSVRQENIDILKGRLTKQITNFKEMSAKVLDKDTSFAKKIWKLFWEQGFTTASILTAIGMAIGILVKALLPGFGGTGTAGNPPPKDKKVLKEWVRNKL